MTFLSNYEARKDLGENDDPNLQYVVWVNSEDTYTGPCFTEAEAKIIAFALNAVHNGAALVWEPDQAHATATGFVYDGPKLT
jgi:hypothetical protein